jgi:two-component system response regulator HydG
MAAVTEASDPEELITAAELERRYIAHVMATVKGNKTVAARILGLDRRTVYRKMSQPPAAGSGSATLGEGAGSPPS